MLFSSVSDMIAVFITKVKATLEKITEQLKETVDFLEVC